MSNQHHINCGCPVCTRSDRSTKQQGEACGASDHAENVDIARQWTPQRRPSQVLHDLVDAATSTAAVDRVRDSHARREWSTVAAAIPDLIAECRTHGEEPDLSFIEKEIRAENAELRETLLRVWIIVGASLDGVEKVRVLLKKKDGAL